jgi:hypothetical protein
MVWGKIVKWQKEKYPSRNILWSDRAIIEFKLGVNLGWSSLRGKEKH